MHSLAAALLLSFVILPLLSCGSGRSDGYYKEEAVPMAAPMEASRAGGAMVDLAKEALPSRSSLAEATGMEIPSDVNGDTSFDGTPADTAPTERKLISTGSMELEVDNLDAADRSLREQASKIGGYIQNSSRYGDSFSMTVKVPAGQFDRFLEESASLGKVRSRSINVDDVSDQYYDLEHRIRNKEILVERYQSYLEEAKSVEDLLTVERQLNDTITELESLKGSYKHLSHLVSFATLHISVYLPSWESEEDPLPSLRTGLRNFGRLLVRVLYSIFFIILGIIGFGIPAVLVIGFFYLLAFGRIGIVRRFFARLRPRSREPRKGTETKE